MQPIWDTPEGSLGVIPEGLFYKLTLSTTADEPVYYSLLSGVLPAGVQVTTTGTVEGVPTNKINVQGVPTDVDKDVTSTFGIRAYTKKTDGSINRISDRTFSLTVTGQDVPEFITPPGNIGTFFDGTEVSIQLQVTDGDLSDTVRFSQANGVIPNGLTLDEKTGLISGVLVPLTGLPDTAVAGYATTQYDLYGYDFSTRSATQNYQFTVEISDGKSSNIRTFEILVYSRDSMTADVADVSADNIFITADTVGTRSPVITTPEGSIGTVRSDNYFAFQFQSYDPDGDTVEYSITVGEGIGYDSGPYSETGVGFDRGAFSLPPGLVIDTSTGWFYGYIPDSGATENVYDFAIQVRKKDNPTFQSPFYYYSIKIVGNIDTEVTWLSPTNLGTLDNGAISDLYVEAQARNGSNLQYQIISGSDSKLPQGLELLETGEIAGRVSFNTFTLDSGTTTFDVDPTTRLITSPTTFDLSYTFNVNAYAPQTEQLGYQVNAISVITSGTGYTSQPTITISAPPNTSNAIQATAGVASIDNGQITAIKLGNPGRGYLSAPTVTITGGGGTDATATATIIQVSQQNSISVNKKFKITIDREYAKPYQSLYIKAMPSEDDRNIIANLLENQDLIPYNSLYRPSDGNFGKADDVKYVHAYGLDTKTLTKYVEAVQLNHYRKQITLGEIKTAQATDSAGKVLYEVVYSELVDDLVNNKGVSVSKSVETAYPIVNPVPVLNQFGDLVPDPLNEDPCPKYPLAVQSEKFLEEARDLNMLANIGSQMARDWMIAEQPGDPSSPFGSQEGKIFNWTPTNQCGINELEPERYARFKPQLDYVASNNRIIFSEFEVEIKGKIHRQIAPFGFLIEEGGVARIAIRGTQTPEDVKLDTMPGKVGNPITNGAFGTGKTAKGFTLGYKGLGPAGEERSATVQGISLAQALQDTTMTELHVGGHSLGSAIATLVAAYAQSLDKFEVIKSYPSASPTVGNKSFVPWFNALADKKGNTFEKTFNRITNVNDTVPTLPGTWGGFFNVGNTIEFNARYVTDNGKTGDTAKNHQICCCYAYALRHPKDPYNPNNQDGSCTFPKGDVPKPPEPPLNEVINFYLDYYADDIRTTVYPNSLDNMRDQVINTVGKVTSGLPQWMISEQTDGRILGFTPAWTIAYVKPGESDRIQYNINQSNIDINKIDFDIDRYELDCSQTHLWDTSEQEWIPNPAIVTTFDRIERPSGLTDIGNVDYATNLAFSQINHKTLNDIAILGGIDGEISRSALQGKTLIFRKQEQFSDLTVEEAFENYQNLYSFITRQSPDQVSEMISFDTVGYDSQGYELPQTEVIVSGSPDPRDGVFGTYDVGAFDQSTILPQNQRLGIWTITISKTNIVTLVFKQSVVTNNLVTVQYGRQYNMTELMLPAAPTPGLTLVAWSFVEEEPKKETTFDVNSTTFSAPADSWSSSDQFDKYIVFPKVNILG